MFSLQQPPVWPWRAGSPDLHKKHLPNRPTTTAPTYTPSNTCRHTRHDVPILLLYISSHLTMNELGSYCQVYWITVRTEQVQHPCEEFPLLNHRLMIDTTNKQTKWEHSAWNWWNMASKEHETKKTQHCRNQGDTHSNWAKQAYLFQALEVRGLAYRHLVWNEKENLMSVCITQGLSYPWWDGRRGREELPQKSSVSTFQTVARSSFLVPKKPRGKLTNHRAKHTHS